VRLGPHGVEHLDQRRQIRAVAADLEDRLAAVPWSGLTTISPWSARNFLATPSERVIAVGGMNWAKSSTQTFSGALRTAAGR
jgi:hypothetical protein